MRIEIADPTEARWWTAVWESGAGAVLDGVAALQAGGLTNVDPARIDVSVPRANRHHPVDGVRLHRRAHMPPAAPGRLPRVVPEHAAVHAALWARSDREAALIACTVIQQRLTTPAKLLSAWNATHHRGPRVPFLRDALVDVCDGAQSLGELDFARLCREAQLPLPGRQVVRQGVDRRVYLDVCWDDVGLVVEVDGGHHQWALNLVADALRQNDRVIAGERVLRIPVLGLRLDPQRFMAQVCRAYASLAAAID